MNARNGYQNTDALQADDEMSPRPSLNDKDADAPPSRDIDHVRGDAQRMPGPATSE
ncbi:hypothetical protein SB748_25585 [Rhizobium sp. SIMBA_035]